MSYPATIEKKPFEHLSIEAGELEYTIKFCFEKIWYFCKCAKSTFAPVNFDFTWKDLKHIIETGRSDKGILTPNIRVETWIYNHSNSQAKKYFKVFITTKFVGILYQICEDFKFELIQGLLELPPPPQPQPLACASYNLPILKAGGKIKTFVILHSWAGALNIVELDANRTVLLHIDDARHANTNCDILIKKLEESGVDSSAFLNYKTDDISYINLITCLEKHGYSLRINYTKCNYAAIISKFIQCVIFDRLENEFSYMSISGHLLKGLKITIFETAKKALSPRKIHLYGDMTDFINAEKSPEKEYHILCENDGYLAVETV